MLSQSPLRQFPGTPVASATSAFLRLGNPLVGGSAQGTYLGINTPAAYTGDIVNYQGNGSSVFRLGYQGNLQMVAAAAAVVPITITAHASQSASLIVCKANGNNNGFHVRKGASDNFYPAGYGDDADTVFASHNTAAADAEQFFVKHDAGTTVLGNARGEIHFNRTGAFETNLTLKSTAGQAAVLQLYSGDAVAGQMVIRWVEGGTQKWQLYKIVTDDSLYLRDIVNGRMQVTYTPGAAGVALTNFGDRVRVTGAADVVQCQVRANGTQTTNLFEAANSSGTALMAITGSGALLSTVNVAHGLGTAGLSATQLAVKAVVASNKALAAVAAASQTANIFEVQVTAGTPRTYAGADARWYMYAPASAPTDGNLVNSSMSPWLDEAATAVKMRIRKSDGTYLTLTIANGVSPTLA